MRCLCKKYKETKAKKHTHTYSEAEEKPRVNIQLLKPGISDLSKRRNLFDPVDRVFAEFDDFYIKNN